MKAIRFLKDLLKKDQANKDSARPLAKSLFISEISQAINSEAEIDEVQGAFLEKVIETMIPLDETTLSTFQLFIFEPAMKVATYINSCKVSDTE